MRIVPWWRVATASEYLVITGAWIADVKIAKKAWILPGQFSGKFDISPVNYTFEVQAMSAEKLPFILPAVFTIGPQAEDRASLYKYAKLTTCKEKDESHMQELVKGIIEGETRVLAASMTMEEIFRGTKEFKKEVFDKVQLELNQFGLKIYNANSLWMFHGPLGEVGSKFRDGQTLQNAAKIDADTKIIMTQRQGEGKKEEIKVKTEVKVFENEREAEVAKANADLAMKKAKWAQNSQMAEVEAKKAVALREAELQKGVEVMNALTQTEKLKAEFLTKASVEYETKVQETNWELYKKQKDAEATLYQKEKEAQAQKAIAEAAFYAPQAAKISKLMAALGGNYGAVRDCLLIDGGMYQELAKINGDAVKGMQPKISIWTGANGSGEGGDGGAMKEVAGVYKMLAPMFDTVHDQLQMLPPPWLGKIAES
ncbi:flotillin-like protein 4 [Tanacetum coccineum]